MSPSIKASSGLAGKRIPAQSSQDYARWQPPDVSKGRVLKAEAIRAERRLPADADVKPWQRDSLEDQLVQNIRAGRFAAGISARQLEAIVRDAAREGREDGYSQGFAKGHQEGHAQGRTDGITAGRGVIEDAATRLSSLIVAMQQPLRNHDAELRDALIEIATRVARAVVRSELQTRPELIRDVVTQALDALPLGAQNIRVFVSPDDLALLQEFGASIREWTLLSDDTMAPGDCRVEARDSLVQYAVSDRLDAMLEQLLPARRAAADDNGT
jgi:flagellar assembly protein FliH